MFIKRGIVRALIRFVFVHTKWQNIRLMGQNNINTKIKMRKKPKCNTKESQRKRGKSKKRKSN